MITVKLSTPPSKLWTVIHASLLTDSQLPTCEISGKPAFPLFDKNEIYTCTPPWGYKYIHIQYMIIAPSSEMIVISWFFGIGWIDTFSSTVTFQMIFQTCNTLAKRLTNEMMTVFWHCSLPQVSWLLRLPSKEAHHILNIFLLSDLLSFYSIQLRIYIQ